jgi:hypothetical protein
MSKKNNLTDIWDVYADSIIKESTKTASPSMRGGTKNFGTKPGKGAVDLDSKQATDIQNKTTSEIEDVDGFTKPIDPKHASKKNKKDNLYTPEEYSSEKFDEKVGKTYKEGININMKSVFDKLFEDVMGDESIEELDALGIDAEEADVDAEETDEITLTLDRETAQKLHDMLMAQLTDEDADEDADEAGDEGFDAFDEAEEDCDDDEELEEATEMKEVPSSAGHKLTSRQNKVGNVKASGGKAQGQVKSTVDGKGKPLPDSAGHKLTSKNNKAGGTKTSSTGGSLFA